MGTKETVVAICVLLFLSLLPFECRRVCIDKEEECDECCTKLGLVRRMLQGAVHLSVRLDHPL
jgi:hypothetical protein